METRYGIHPDQAKSLDTAGLRREFLVQGLFKVGELNLLYSHTDRIIVGGAVPTSRSLELHADRQSLGSDHFLERRELGVINLGGPGVVRVDGAELALGRLDGLYVGKGTRRVELTSQRSDDPAKYYLASGMAHRTLSTKAITNAMMKHVVLGSSEESNRRTIHQVVHPDVLETCSLVMGFTCLEPGSVWNTMPCHTHERRMEVYLYFDVPDNAVVLHLMGQPAETRHIVARNHEAVIAPSWSIHSGVGTSSYSFIWAMVGENQTFTDMDAVPMDVLR
ncbi:MAG: 5-dehydro-4-deoxy-D-glucuronate isomerase [Polyangiaceae bacterium]|nr:5-dehydro-4-deoxy-D-glucuronate isomerase [Polyangiaceae bacterium]